MRTKTEQKLEDLERNREIIIDALMPDSTLQIVGDKWGLTKERVRQIFISKLGKTVASAKKQLILEGKIVCKMCGLPLNASQVRGGNKFCTVQCAKLTTKFEKEPVKCAHCGGLYFRTRNWRHTAGNGPMGGKFCSIKHYKIYSIGKKRWSEEKIGKGL